MNARPKKLYLLVSTLLVPFLNAIPASAPAEDNLDRLLPIRGLAIAAPSPRQLDVFITFIQKELVPRRVNTLILRVDYKYQYESHPELRDREALSNENVKKLVEICQAHHIDIIPQINLPKGQTQPPCILP